MYTSMRGARSHPPRLRGGCRSGTSTPTNIGRCGITRGELREVVMIRLGGEDFIWGGLHTTFCTILRKKQETMVHTMSKSHEALIIACPMPRPGPMYGVKRRINKSLQDLPKNLNLILSFFPPASYQFFFFCFSPRTGRTTSPNPGGAHKPHHESFENVSDVCYRDNNLAPHWVYARGIFYAQAATEAK